MTDIQVQLVKTPGRGTKKIEGPFFGDVMKFYSLAIV